MAAPANAAAEGVSMGFIAGNRRTSLISDQQHENRENGGVGIDILVESVKNITNRSMPIPQPPVGGSACSSLHHNSIKIQ